MAHLTITDRFGSIGRIRRIQAEAHPLLPEVDEETTLRESGLLDESTQALVTGFLEARIANVRWLGGLSSEAFERSGNHASVGELTAEQLLFHAA